MSVCSKTSYGWGDSQFLETCFIGFPFFCSSWLLTPLIQLIINSFSLPPKTQSGHLHSTNRKSVYPLKANFRVHLSSSRCSPVSWDVVPTTVSDFQLFCQPQSRFSISFSLYQAGLAWLMILTLFFHGTVRFVRFDGQKTPWAATVSKPVAQSTAPTLFSNLNNSIYAIATIHVSAMKPKNGSKKHSNIIWRSYWLLHLHALPLPYKIKQW